MDALTVADELLRLLAQRGIALEARGTAADVYRGAGADVSVAWASFARLAAVPVGRTVVVDDETLTVPAVDGDRLLFETIVGRGLVAGSGDHEEVLRASCSRHFVFTDANGDDVGMNRLLLAFEAPASDAARAVADVQLWGDTGERAGEWLAAVERSPAFAHVMDAATRFWVHQSELC